MREMILSLVAEGRTVDAVVPPARRGGADVRRGGHRRPGPGDPAGTDHRAARRARRWRSRSSAPNPNGPGRCSTTRRSGDRSRCDPTGSRSRCRPERRVTRSPRSPGSWWRRDLAVPAPGGPGLARVLVPGGHEATGRGMTTTGHHRERGRRGVAGPNPPTTGGRRSRRWDDRQPVHGAAQATRPHGHPDPGDHRDPDGVPPHPADPPRGRAQDLRTGRRLRRSTSRWSRGCCTCSGSSWPPPSARRPDRSTSPRGCSAIRWSPADRDWRSTWPGSPPVSPSSCRWWRSASPSSAWCASSPHRPTSTSTA